MKGPLFLCAIILGGCGVFLLASDEIFGAVVVGTAIFLAFIAGSSGT